MLKRQGELLFISIKESDIPATAVKQDRKGQTSIVLARGREGNTHRFESAGALFTVPDDAATLYVVLPEGGTLVHGDGTSGHASVTFEPGAYRVHLHQEWTAAGNRVVED